VDKPRVLVAEDSPMLRALMKKALEAAGVSVILAENGRQALELAQAEAFDLIALDNCMPELDGTEVCAELKADARWSAIPVIIITGDEQPRPCGADRYVVKDAGFASLVAAVRELLAI